MFVCRCFSFVCLLLFQRKKLELHRTLYVNEDDDHDPCILDCFFYHVSLTLNILNLFTKMIKFMLILLYSHVFSLAFCMRLRQKKMASPSIFCSLFLVIFLFVLFDFYSIVLLFLFCWSFSFLYLNNRKKQKKTLRTIPIRIDS